MQSNNWVTLILLVAVIILTLVVLFRKPPEDSRYREILDEIETIREENTNLLEAIRGRDSLTSELREQLEQINSNIDELNQELEETQQERDRLFADLDGSNVGQRYKFFSSYSDTAGLAPYVFVVEE